MNLESWINKGGHFIKCQKNGKAPAQSWKDTNAPNFETVSKWIDDGFNIGIKSGNKFFVVDIDDKHLFDDFVKKYNATKTFTVETPHGYHLYYSVPNGIKIKNSNGIIPKIDIKPLGSYLICPPSEIKGKKYFTLHDLPISEPSKEIIELAKEKTAKTAFKSNKKPFECNSINSNESYAQAALKGEIQKVLSAPVGTRNPTLNKAAFSLGTLIESGKLSESIVKSELENAALQIGLQRHEIKKTIESGLNSGQKNPRNIPSLKNVSCNQQNLSIENPIDKLQSDLPKILLPGDNTLQSDFAKSAGEVCAKNDFYNFNGLPVIIENGGTKIVESYNFRTSIEKIAVCIKSKKINSQSFTVKNSCSIDTAKTTLASPFFLEPLPILEKMFDVPLPVIRGGKLETLTTGYNSKEKIFVKKDSVNYDTNWSFERGKEYIENLLKEFPFTDKRSRAIVIGGMLTEFCRLILPENCQIPVFIFCANAEGSGKTLLTKIINFPVHGLLDIKSLPNNENGIHDELNTAVLHAKNSIIFDNIRGNLRSASLEAFITAVKWSFRVKGFNKEFCGSADINLYLTGNDLTYTPDLRRRSLQVDLFSKFEHSEDREIKNWIDDISLMEMRSDILSSLFALVRSWHEAKQPPCKAYNSTFKRWTQIVPAILEHSNLGDCLAKTKSKKGGDKTGDDMNSLVKAMTGNLHSNEIKFAEVIETAFNNSLFDWIITSEDLDRKGRTIFSRLLKRYDERNFNIDGEMVFFEITGNGHSKRFCTEKIK